jgi:peptide/nickel transport system ATP-binding protein
MHKGRIVEYGPKDTVIPSPRQLYTQRLIASVPEMATGWLDAVVAARKVDG